MSKSLFRRITKHTVILVNLAITLLFLAGCYSEYVFSRGLWPVGFLTLGLFYIFLTLVGFAIFWLLVRPRWALLFVATVALSYDHIQQIIPFRFHAPFSLDKRPGNLRLLSWNVAQFDALYAKANPAKQQAMYQQVLHVDADIACFQELVAADSIVDIDNDYYRKYQVHYVDSMVQQLGFRYYQYSYNYKENFLHQQHFGLAIFSKHPIVNQQTISYYPHDYNSRFQYADIVVEKDTVRVFNVHLQSLRFSVLHKAYLENPGLNTEEDKRTSLNILEKFKLAFQRRKLQADRIRIEIDKSPYPVLVCGDFNDVPNSYAYEIIGKHLQNAFVAKGAGLGRTYQSISPTLRIDHIFTDKQFSIHQFGRLVNKLSDHYALVTDLQTPSAQP